MYTTETQAETHRAFQASEEISQSEIKIVRI